MPVLFHTQPVLNYRWVNFFPLIMGIQMASTLVFPQTFLKFMDYNIIRFTILPIVSSRKNEVSEIQSTYLENLAAQQKIP